MKVFLFLALFSIRVRIRETAQRIVVVVVVVWFLQDIVLVIRHALYPILATKNDDMSSLLL